MVGTEVKLEGEELIIMKESDIMGVLEARRRGTKGRLGERERWLPRKSNFMATHASACCAARTSSPCRQGDVGPEGP